jgi:hypothetical protein
VANALIWGGAAFVGSRHPELAVAVDAGAGYLSGYAAPVVAQLRSAASLIMRRRGDRVARVLLEAAARAGVDIDELAARLAGGEQREQLLIRTLDAAAGTAMESWLPLYATALANGTVADNLGVVSWETTFLRVVSDLDGGHVLLLDLFTRTANELGLGNGEPDFDKPPEVLDEVSLQIAAPDLPNHVALLAVLERHGLVAGFTPSGGTFSRGPSKPRWRLTDFGRDVHARLLEVGGLLTP